MRYNDDQNWCTLNYMVKQHSVSEDFLNVFLIFTFTFGLLLNIFPSYELYSLYLHLVIYVYVYFFNCLQN